MQICSLCGLFGTHKNHTILVDEELARVNRRMLAELQVDRRQLSFAAEYSSSKTFSDLLLKHLKSRLNSFKKEYESLYTVC